jgi:hypothetical protein
MKTALAITFAVALLSACISTNDSSAFLSTVRSTPMGPSQFMVACVDSPMYCAAEANKLCPQGFDVKSNVTNPADYGRMTMIIKCN